MGKKIYDFRKKIQLVQSDLNQIGEPTPDISELIDAAIFCSGKYLVVLNNTDIPFFLLEMDISVIL